MLSQDILLQNIRQNVNDSSSYLLTNVGNLTTNQFIIQYNVFQQLQKNYVSEILQTQEFINSFKIGLCSQIEDEKTLFSTQPQGHLQDVQQQISDY